MKNQVEIGKAIYVELVGHGDMSASSIWLRPDCLTLQVQMFKSCKFKVIQKKKKKNMVNTIKISFLFQG